MTLNDLLLCATAVAAGMVNSVAGGGTLLTFPALFSALGPAGPAAGVLANGTSTVALWPGSLVAAWEYRHDLRQSSRWLAWLLVPSVIGGLAGALLVTELRPELFDSLVPWLILTAALLLALQPQISRLTVAGPEHHRPTLARLAILLLFQSGVALYGGYFGAGIGILMLGALGLMGLSDIHVMNAVKNVLATCINGMAATVFLARGKVEWHLAWPMLVSAIVGGFLGSRIARRTDKAILRRVVVTIGFSLAAYYFYRQLHG